MLAELDDGTQIYRDVDDINNLLNQGWTLIQTAKAVYETGGFEKDKKSRYFIICFRLAKNNQKVLRFPWDEIVVRGVTKSFIDIEDTPEGICSIKETSSHSEYNHLIENDYILLNQGIKFASSQDTAVYYLGMQK